MNILKNGELLGYSLTRKEKFIFHIFKDGSTTVEIKTDDNKKYIFGNLNYCKKMFKAGYSFCNTPAEKDYILTPKFKRILGGTEYVFI